jgi:hypothetical protein
MRIMLKNKATYFDKYGQKYFQSLNVSEWELVPKRRRFMKGDFLLRRLFDKETFIIQTFCEEMFCMCARYSTETLSSNMITLS